MSNPNYSHGEFCWLELGTRDVPGSKAFYKAVAGIEHRDDPMPGEGDEKYTTLMSDGKQIGGCYAMVGDHFEGVPPHWLAYIYVDDVDAAVEAVKAGGGTVAADVMDIPGICRMAVAQDPQGATFGLFHPLGHPGMARNGFQPGGFGWLELATTDTAAAKAFYGSVFGWDSDTVDMGGFDYTSYKLGDNSFAGMMAMDGPEWEGIPPNWTPYLTVADIDAAFAAAMENGGQVRVPINDVPNVGRFAVVGDAGGANVALIQYVPVSEGEGEPEPAAASA